MVLRNDNFFVNAVKYKGVGMRKKTLFRGSIAVSTAAILAAGVLGTPARAADVTISIWTFGDVIQRTLVKEYKALHPEITLEIKKVFGNLWFQRINQKSLWAFSCT